MPPLLLLLALATFSDARRVETTLGPVDGERWLQ